MPSKLFTTTCLLTLVTFATAQSQSAFNLTAIAAYNNAFRLECWQLAAPPVLGRGAVNFELGPTGSGFVGVIPPRTYAGSTIQNAASVQYSLFLSGLAHITIPMPSSHSTQQQIGSWNHGADPWSSSSCSSAEQNEVWIRGGKFGIIIAADLKNKSATGHITEFPGSDTTVIAQFPVPGDVEPEHTVLYVGPCRMEDMLGL